MTRRMLFLVLAITYACMMVSGLQMQRSIVHSHSSSRATSRTSFSLSMSSSSDNVKISLARDFVATGFGIKDPSLLNEDFLCSGPFFSLQDKAKYVSALSKETSAFTRAMPDFDFRPYDFVVDEVEPSVVWFKIRPKGILSGPFAYRGEVYLPTQKLVELPLQQCSVTISANNKVSRVTAGYVIDRFTGNTNGLPGPFGVLYALGYPPNRLLLLPFAVAVKQLFARNKKPSTKTPTVSPFPDSVMISLAKQLVSTQFGASDPSLLSSDFTYSGPLVGPLSKDEFIKTYSSIDLSTTFPNLKVNAYSYKIDSYDPSRVWLIVRSSGTQELSFEINGKDNRESIGSRYNGPPEAVSVSIDAQGRCFKVTAEYVIDREKGNTNGLGGISGVLEAIGEPLPFWQTRSIFDLLRIFKEKFFPAKNVVVVAKPAAAVKAPAASAAPAPAPKPALSTTSFSSSFPSPPPPPPPPRAPAPAPAPVPAKPIATASTTVKKQAASEEKEPSTDDLLGGFFKGLGQGQAKAASTSPLVVITKAATTAATSPAVIVAPKPAVVAAKQAAPVAAATTTTAKTTTTTAPIAKKAPVASSSSSSSSPPSSPFSFFGGGNKKPSSPAAVKPKAPTTPPPPLPVNKPIAVVKPSPAPAQVAPVAKKAAAPAAASSSSPFSFSFFGSGASKNDSSVKSSKANVEAPRPPAPPAKPAPAAKAAPAQAAKPAPAAKAAPAAKPVPAPAKAAPPAPPKAAPPAAPAVKFVPKASAPPPPPVKKSVIPPAPVPLRAAPPKSSVSSSSSSSTSTSSSSLISSAVSRYLDRIGKQKTASDLDAVLQRLVKGTGTAEAVYKTLKESLGKDAAQEIFPDVVGGLPAGPARKALFSYLQTQAN